MQFKYTLSFEPLVTGKVRCNRFFVEDGSPAGHIDYTYAYAKGQLTFWSANPSGWGMTQENVEEIEVALALIEEQRDRRQTRSR